MLDRVTLAPATGVAPVLSEASLTLAAGATLALVGPSGAGKSTLLAAIAGEIAPLSGRILVEGMEPHRREQRARAAIALVAQGHDLVDALDAKRNAMAGALGRWSSVKALREFVLPSHAARTEARTALAAVGLGGMENRRTGSLSGGERQRVAIARALVQAPRLLLADEPVASLDPDNAARILDLLTGLARERNMALLCTLHQPELATRYFDRVARLNAGRLEIGTA